MNRREFLKSLVATAIAISVPVQLASVPGTVTFTRKRHGFYPADILYAERIIEGKVYCIANIIEIDTPPELLACIKKSMRLSFNRKIKSPERQKA
jgi:hypothetical protein